MTALGGGVAAVALSACADRGAPSVPGPFSASGQLVAMSGGEAGPRAACFTCHGLDGGGDGAGAPRLSGVPAGYLLKQLEDYASGRRADDTMSVVARRLSPEERRRVAFWYAGRPAAARNAGGASDEVEGRRLYHMGDPGRGLQPCAACHGRSGEGGGAGNPPLWGQPSPYLGEQLRRWKHSERRNDPRHVMLTISRRLTDAEIRSLADYASALPGGPDASATAASPPASRPDPTGDVSAQRPRAQVSAPEA